MSADEPTSKPEPQSPAPEPDDGETARRGDPPSAEAAAPAAPPATGNSRALWSGVVILAVGLALTIGSALISAGGTGKFVVATGAIVIGILRILQGLSAGVETPAETSPAKADGAAPGPAEAQENDEREEEPPPIVPETPANRRYVSLVVAAFVAIGFFFLLPPLSRSGLWDPFELNVADLGRRVAIHVYGANALVLAGAENGLPYLNDLGRPELPFTSIALGFKLFGLHEWAGRAPLAAWGLAGVLAVYATVARLFDRRAGVYAALALTTMPLYFVQARSMMGEITTMSALAMSFGGLAVAVFDRDEKGPTSPVARLPWVLLAALGLVSGYYSRGALLGVAVPSLSIGLAWAVSWAAAKRRLDIVGDVLGGLALGAGVVVAWKGLSIFGQEKPPKDLSMWVGAVLKAPGKYPTFDFYVAAIGHSTAPWSAFVPFALGRLFIPPLGRVGAVEERERFARVAILIGAIVLFVAHGWLAARTDPLAFTGPAVLAAACGVAVRDFERGAHASIAVGVGTVVLLGVMHHDFHELPEKAYQAFAIVGAQFPESFKKPAIALWWVVLGGFALISFLTWIPWSTARRQDDSEESAVARPSNHHRRVEDSKRTPFDPKNYLEVVRKLRAVWDGVLVLAYFALVAGASLAALLVWVGLRYAPKAVPQMSLQFRDGVLNAWWIVALGPPAAIFGTFFAADLWLWMFNRSRGPSRATFTRGFEPFEALLGHLRAARDGAQVATAWTILVPLMVLAVPVGTLVGLLSAGVKPLTAALLSIPSGVLLFLILGAAGDVLRHRAAGLAAGGALVGGVLCGFYYPSLASQLSPKEVFESYQRVHKAGEPLALLGVGNRSAAYYAGGQPTSFADPAAAHQWLSTTGEGRRFLALRADDLPRLNMLYRQQTDPKQNLPILDARSSQILLAASTLLPTERNENPLNRMLLNTPPANIQRKLEANLDDKLLVVGIDLVDANGRLLEAIAPGRKVHMRTYYKVLAPVGSEWEAFIHIDGYRKRHNGDHKPMNGKYPMSLWNKGDVLVDDYEFALEPNFTPGTYTIYFGLFVGDTRFKVKSGPNDNDNRIIGGALKVQ